MDRHFGIPPASTVPETKVDRSRGTDGEPCSWQNVTEFA